MKIKSILKYICLLAPAIIFACSACSGSNNDGEGEKPVPKFILSGVEDRSDTNFIYYSIGSGAYAVALTETGKSQASVTIPSTVNEDVNKPVTGIWRYGFANSQATSITIPESITVIDFEAFMNSKITSVTIPASVSQIGEGAFYACKAITKVMIHNTSSSSESSSACMCGDGSGSGSGGRTPSELKLIPSFCFYNCNNIKELVLPESIEEIGYEAFNGCRQLYSTIAFANIKAIRSRAFQDCAALKKVYISSTFFEREEDQQGEPTGDPIGVIEDKAFDRCNSALKFYLVGDEDDVQAWLDLHNDNKWRWKNEKLNPAVASNLYEYEITPSGASYSNDWIYTTSNNEVTITSYIGPTEIEVEVDEEKVTQQVKLITFPNELPSGSGNYVTRINIDALDSVKANLERVYFPTTLKRIESRMFDNYPKLVVVDDNTGTKCTVDEDAENIDKRIVLSGLTSLEVIGNSAFVNMGKLNEITKLYLPYSLKAVGKNAFGYADSKNGKHMLAVTDFRWDYDDENSALEVIGGGAFYGLGRSDSSKLVTSGAVHQGRYAGETENYQLTSLVFPRTFKHFGITDADRDTYELDSSEDDNASFGANAFAGSPLLSEVIFKGSKAETISGSPSINTPDTDTYDLVIPTQTFVLNESLRTVVFEERCGRSILFHTAGRLYQPAIGWSSGKRTNDFSGNPAIQTIVLPNMYTTIRMQQYAMQGNSRGVIYLSGNGDNSNFKGCSEASCKKIIKDGIATGNVDNLNSDGKWRLIGDESFDTNAKTYPGYCFASKVNDKTTETYNRFGLNQSMPIHANVSYNQTVTTKTADGVVNVNVFVGVGNTNEFIISNKCAFVTYRDGNKNYATLTKYLYDRYDSAFTGTAVVPPTVTKSDGTTICTVNKIGNSAFSAAYCDETSNNYKNDLIHKDLVSVAVPDTIANIGEYAFMRAYGVRNLYSYDPGSYVADTVPNPRVADNYYVMPTSLSTVGKHAFAFCNIEQFLRIPNNCSFYDTNSDTKYETSVFSNNFSLRKITFGESDAASSTKYETTTYTTHDESNIYTSAIYSTNSVSNNKLSLLLVLNRDSDDRLCESSDVSKKSKEVDEETVYYSELNGQYGGRPYIFGAFKMCYWVDSLVVGTPKAATKDYDQPLISGIYDVANGKDNLIYLNNPNDFNTNKNNCRLESVTFNGSLATPAYSFEGCGNLKYVTLPRIPNGEVPSGLFAFVSNSGMQFRVPSDATGENFIDCEPGVLDLTYTAYSKINADAFKGTQINTLIAPKPWDDDDPETENNPNHFTIEQDAFRGCTELSLIDFSNVTGRVIINGSFRGTSTAGDITKISNDLFNFGTTAKIEFGDEAFMGATFTGDPNDQSVKKTFTFPAKTAIIGNSCFEECTTLQKVTAESVLTELEPVAVDTGTGKNNSDIATLYANGYVSSSTGFKQIGNSAFFHCTSLQDFDFSKFEGVERIGHTAFSMVSLNSEGKINIDENTNRNVTNTATICTGGVIDLPASITNIGVGAFYGSKITKITINSSTIRLERAYQYTDYNRVTVTNNKGGHTFRWCTELTEIFFSNPKCEWRQVYLTKDQKGQDNFFSNCGNLGRVVLPRGQEIGGSLNGFNIQPSNYTGTGNDQRPDSMAWHSYGSMQFYLYHTVNDITPTSLVPRVPNPIISDYWHRMNDGVVADLIYYVRDESDVVAKNNNNEFVEILGGRHYWTIKDGSLLYLGTANIDKDTGAVTFSTGNTLNSLSYSINGGAATSLAYDALSTTTRASTNIILAANDEVSVTLNNNALKYGASGDDTSFTAPDTGAYIITVNGSDRFTYELPATAVDIQENSVSISSRTMYVGDADATLVAVLSPEHSTDEVTWTSSDDGVATVDSNGVVHAVGRGTATITATAGSVSDSVTVDVHTYYSLLAGDNEYLLNNHKGSGETEEYYSDIIELDAGDTVQILYDGDTPTEGVYSRNTEGHNNLGESGIVNAGEVEVYANKYTKQIWVTGFARITYNGTSYIAERGNDTSYYIDVDLVSGNAVTAGSIGSSDLTASLSVDTGTGNNLKDNAGALTVISTSNNARIYLHSDGSVWVTGLALEDSFKLIYGTDGGSESTWGYANGATGNALTSADPNVESQAEFVVTLAQNEEFKILDVNGNYLGADIAESPYYRSEGGNIVLNCLGEHHIYLKKYTNGNYGIAIAVENHTISLDLTTSSSWTDSNAVIWAYVWEGTDAAQGSAWYRASNYTEITINGSYSNMILVRKNPSNDYAGWDGMWNQTSDLSLNDTTYNQILTITGWDNSSTWVDKE